LYEAYGPLSSDNKQSAAIDKSGRPSQGECSYGYDFIGVTIKFFCQTDEVRPSEWCGRGGLPGMARCSTFTKPSWWDSAPLDQGGFRGAYNTWKCCGAPCCRQNLLPDFNWLFVIP
jgi:hypothetical protein